MALPPEDKINAAIVQLEEDTGYLHRFRAGGETEKVPVEAGDIPTLSGLVAEIRADSAVATTEAVQAATAAELAASQAHALSVEARNAANAANTASQSANNRAAAAEQAALDAADAAGSVVGLLDNKVDKVENHTLYPAADKNKLASIAVGATKNQSDAVLKDRANHTGTQAISTVSGLQQALDSKASTSTLGTAATRNMGTGAADLRQNSQNDAWFVAKSQIKGVAGQSTTDVMSQKAATDSFVAKAQIKGSTGQSSVDIMHQKAVTDAIAAAVAAIDMSGPRPVKDHGAVATDGSQTVVCNVQESDFHMLDMSGAKTTGTLTIDFANMPDTVGKHFSWHVRLRRGGRKGVNFAQTISWAGGSKPSFGNTADSYDIIMFYKVGNETIRGMVVDVY